MSSEVVIRAAGLDKTFPIYRKAHHRLMQIFMPGPVGRWHDEFRALRNINLEIRSGETVGIVGRNGSGKSTLLQIICGTVAPTSGQVEVKGRIAALLELGAGFNPEFTGRENVYLYGAVLGLSRSQVDSRFDAIVAFADIGPFLDQPVKTYSSGMFVRLAFAVAINVDPDILIVDEALSVGDEAFQRKCFARIEQIREGGATILFVSHSAGTVVDLCDRALLLDAGQMLAQGRPKHIVGLYQKLIYSSAERAKQLREALLMGFDEDARSDVSSGAVAVGDVPGDVQENPQMVAFWEEGFLPASTLAYEHRGVHIEDPHLETLDGRRVNVITAGHLYVYRYQVYFSATHAGVRAGMMLRTVTGTEVAGTATAAEGEGLAVVEAGQTLDVSFRLNVRLAPGTYFLNAGVLALESGGEQYVARLLDAAMVRVLPSDRVLTALVDLDFEAQVALV